MFAEIHEYLLSVTPKRPPILREMEKYAAKNGFPIIGPLVGRFLYQAAALTDARRVLELGSGYGYSAYWFSMAMGPKGRIVMTDTDAANRDRALAYFRRGRLRSHFDYHVGDALAVARKISGPFDIVLNDIDKQDYPRTIDLAARRLRKGGLFITDNVIWSGKVCQKRSRRDAATKGIVEFNKNLYEDERFFTTILPIRDGIALAIRV